MHHEKDHFHREKERDDCNCNHHDQDQRRHHHYPWHPHQHHSKNNFCTCHHDGGFLSKKMKIKYYEKRLAKLKEHVEDIEEYIKELKA